MTRAEILSGIKQAEEEATVLVARANEAKHRTISEAHLESKELLKQAEEEAQKYAESEMSKARKKIDKEREKIIEKGAAEAEENKKNAKKNVTKATNFILSEFERAVNA
ncbi:MAG: ATP synthase archaeal subunit H [Candidatus Methanoperedenaceae archaeon]|nr:ATP synthase archaeal subunit H [Candidatus Methanoperedenaceae archaeon]MDW7726341.1 ATP synthase archaeal subunit H [Candidatus Methanoperedens sp.]